MIQELQTGILDINNKYNINFSCKQLDDIILKLIIYDKSLPADLSNYNVRLKAFKADQVPLIQNTNITIKDNVITIKADKQLTTTNGIVKAELQFINKTTLEKKSTFYINIEVVASVLDVEGTVSTPTCTILEEIDHKLDQIENIGEVLDEAKEVRDTLTNKTIPTATSINSKLETNIGNASTKITEVESIISSASIKIEEVETCINNADFSKKELDLSKTNADMSKENLNAANTLAEKNIEELNKLGDVTDLAKNVQTNITDIGTLKTDVENNTSQLKDCAKKDGTLQVNLNAQQLGGRCTEAYMQNFDINDKDFNLIVDCGVYRFNVGNTHKPPGCGDYGQLFVMHGAGDTIAQICIDLTNKVFVRSGNPKEVHGGGNWLEWKQLATTETVEIILLNGWEKSYGELEITKTGGICYLNFQGTVGVGSIGTTIFNIPEGFCPKYQQVFYIPQRDGKPFYGVAIDTNGNVNISGVTTLPVQGTKTDFYMMWRVD
ncbi:pyocin knob domain-containing protein [Clostridium cagae]|uniref:pyocin knob domain-containing protein n=1 Tax=Clostridium cagae TaxID=2080751 RepID=UPI003F75A409